jgi:5-methylcytosine-specific restriction protein A
LNFDPALNPGDTINNDRLTEIFRCSPQGGMRRSLTTNTLVLVSDPTRGIYEDRWVEDVLHYTGMGLEGDQNINFAQNKTLAESNSNGVEVYLFEVIEAGSYLFRGRVQLTGAPYQDEQPGKDGSLRKVWIFPLKPSLEAQAISIPEPILTKKQKQREKEARRLSDAELKIRAKYSKKVAGTRQVSTSTYDRNAYVAELARRRAAGHCQLCGNPAPFKDTKSEPFLESYHIIWLSQGGEDSIENTVALCPNCHRKMHVLNLDSDKMKLKLASQGETL